MMVTISLIMDPDTTIMIINCKEPGHSVMITLEMTGMTGITTMPTMSTPNTLSTTLNQMTVDAATMEIITEEAMVVPMVATETASQNVLLDQ